MAESDDGTSEIKWLVGILVLLGIIWFASGGPDREQVQQGPLLYFDIEDKEDSGGRGNSTYSSDIHLDRGTATADSPEQEYVEIEADENAPETTITGWKLESSITGNIVSLPAGTYLPRLGTTNTKEPIRLKGGERAIVLSGSSPIGTSFKTNKCTGYLEENLNFRPSLNRDCPLLEEEDLSGFGITIKALGSDDYDACIDFIEGISECSVVSTADPGFPECRKVRFDDDPPDECINFDECRAVIRKHANYAGCVALHSKDSDFYGDEWRIYLGTKGDLWRERKEIILLKDALGQIVDGLNY